MAKKVSTSEKKVRQIRRKSRKQYSGEEKIRIVLDGLRGEESVSELCRREGITECTSSAEMGQIEAKSKGEFARQYSMCQLRLLDSPSSSNEVSSV